MVFSNSCIIHVMSMETDIDRGAILYQGTGVTCRPLVPTGAVTLASAISLPYFLEFLKLGSGPWGHSSPLPGILGSEGLLALSYTPYGVCYFSFPCSGHHCTLWAQLLLGGWWGSPGAGRVCPLPQRTAAGLRVSSVWRTEHGGAEALCSAGRVRGAWLSAPFLETQEEAPEARGLGSAW